MSIYARRMRDGISMQDIDQMDALMHFDVMKRELEMLEEAEERREEERAMEGKNVVELRRGTIDMVL